MKCYKDLVQDILSNGIFKRDRTGVNSISVFGRMLRWNLKDGFPAVTHKKLYWKGVVGELLWFLKGDTNIKFLIDNNINIWNLNGYQYYKRLFNSSIIEEKFIENTKNKVRLSNTYKFGDLGYIYGYQWNKNNQLNDVIQELKTNKFSRRLLVNSWDHLQSKECALPPCHYSFQFNVVEKENITYLNCMFNMRSNDVILG